VKTGVNSSWPQLDGIVAEWLVPVRYLGVEL